jgi:hypothetical protein
MTRAALRWTLILTCLLVVGPAAMFALARVHDADAGNAVTLLLNDHALGAILGMVLTLVGAVLAGVCGARFFSLNTGCLCAGLVLAWGRWGLGTLEDLVRRAGDASPLAWLAAENVLVVTLALALALGMGILSARQQGAARPGWFWLFARADGSGRDAGNARVGLAAGLAAGAVALVLMSWLIAANGLRGQTLMAAALGALACGAAGQLVAASLRTTLTPAAVVAVVLVVAGASPIVAMVMHADRLVEAVYQARVFGPAMPLSLDWAAGALLGAPIGLSWAGAMVDARASDE